MTKRNIYIAGVAFVIAGTVGVASWMSAEVGGQSQHSVATSGSEVPGVAETEGVVTGPVTVEPQAAAIQPLEPATFAPPAEPRPEPRRGLPAVSARTPVAAPAPRPEAAEATPIARPEPETRSAESKATPVEMVQPAERIERLELVVPAGTVLGIRLNTAVTSENAEVEDRVEGTVTRDVVANGHIAIPSGTRVLGSVNEVTRGGKFKERARIGVRFHTLVLADGTRETMRVDAVVREGDSPVRESAAKIGIGAAGGAIVGGIMGGKKGALLGGAAGAGAGAATVAAGDRSIAAIATGTPLSIRLDAPVKVIIDRGP